MGIIPIPKKSEYQSFSTVWKTFFSKKCGLLKETSVAHPKGISLASQGVPLEKKSVLLAKKVCH